MKYKAILFDMDGVLIESEWLMRDTSIQSLAEYGVQARHEDFLEFTGCGEDRFVGGVAEKYGLRYDPAMKERAYDFFGQRVLEETDVPEGVRQMLETLHARGLKLAVCSAADRRKVMYNLMAIGVTEDKFGAFITGSDVERKKPSRTSISWARSVLAWNPGTVWWWRTPSAASRPPMPPEWTPWVCRPPFPGRSWWSGSIPSTCSTISGNWQICRS